ncbi:hypothetical protein [uncultured Desulfobacter sp.]|uniref:hypothetical protein n=1 Tax=uncultured Desulfobacter sp. TaxID=240139 RepID=UPI002AAABDB1|nr:hypothetical protein [uncultured Desulfobacter sp.]
MPAAQTVRTTILSTPEFKAWLTSEAEKEGVSVSELVRKRCKPVPEVTEQEDKLLNALLQELERSTKQAHEAFDKGLAQLNETLDRLDCMESARMKVERTGINGNS